MIENQWGDIQKVNITIIVLLFLDSNMYVLAYASFSRALFSFILETVATESWKASRMDT